jgi:SAM-dependent methyltransferase
MGTTRSVQRADRWESGSGYEAYIGRWSRLVAASFVDGLAIEAGRSWVDVGCGTGALTQVVLARTDPSTVIGIDPSAAFVDYARATVRDRRASFMTGDGAAIPLTDDVADVAVSGLVLNFVLDPVAMLTDMRRVTRPDGLMAVYVWDYAGRMQLIRHFWDAAIGLDPAARAEDEGVRFPICGPDPLREAFGAAGLRDVEIRPIEVQTVFSDFDDYWIPFLSATGPAPAYAMRLTDDARAVLRERIRASLPIEEDGSIHLVARAWAAIAVT